MYLKKQITKPFRYLYRKISRTEKIVVEEKKFIPRNNHYHIVSFPKSGNTWVRFLLANILCDQSIHITFKNIGSYIPDSHRIYDLNVIYDSSSIFNSLKTQFVKSHSCYDPDFKNIIYMVRDGRDALTSFYHWINARRKEHVTLSEIINGNIGNSGLWSKHVLGWLKVRCNNKMILKYEDLTKDTLGEFKKILDFAEIKIDDNRIQRAIKLSSVENMKKIESKYGLFDGDNKFSKKTPFVRKGTCGDWKNLFQEDDIKLFWEYHQEAMQVMNYLD